MYCTVPALHQQYSIVALKSQLLEFHFKATVDLSIDLGTIRKLLYFRTFIHLQNLKLTVSFAPGASRTCGYFGLDIGSAGTAVGISSSTFCIVRHAILREVG